MIDLKTTKRIILVIIATQLIPLGLVIMELFTKCHPLLDAYLAGILVSGIAIGFYLLLILGFWLMNTY